MTWTFTISPQCLTLCSFVIKVWQLSFYCHLFASKPPLPKPFNTSRPMADPAKSSDYSLLYPVPANNTFPEFSTTSQVITSHQWSVIKKPTHFSDPICQTALILRAGFLCWSALLSTCWKTSLSMQLRIATNNLLIKFFAVSRVRLPLKEIDKTFAHFKSRD